MSGPDTQRQCDHCGLWCWLPGDDTICGRCLFIATLPESQLMLRYSEAARDEQWDECTRLSAAIRRLPPVLTSNAAD
jgi:hypothetical protein